jgi:hypothetical protein
MPHVRLVDPDCRDVDAAAIAAAGPPAAGAASVRTGVRGEGRQEP